MQKESTNQCECYARIQYAGQKLAKAEAISDISKHRK
jgi:hypothetical protein